MAMSLDRSAIVTALFKGYADVGNDSPFAPVYPSTNASVPQRSLNVAKAKALLAAAGHPNGFSATLTGEVFQEIPQYAQVVQQSARAIGVNLKLNVEPQPKYYGNFLFGTSDWLDATLSLVDYGHRSVPNVFLTAPLQTTNAKKGTGAWNAAHFSNSDYDKLSNQYIATSDLQSQKTIAGQIETLLLNETPIIYGYFYNYLTASAKNVTGAYPTAVGHIFLYNCKKS
jgi:peptide/nickel transport system substrate-binding protein